MYKESVNIKPGHHNTISLTALRVDADESINYLDPYSRKCRFQHESLNLKIFKQYTYGNCMFECRLHDAIQKYDCIPWYFPFSDEKFNLCSPWITREFLDYMNNIKMERSPNCMPECRSTFYESSINTFPFRKCDLANKEMSLLCTFSSPYSKPLPKKYISQLHNLIHDPQSIYTDSSQSYRSYDSENKKGFPNNSKVYDAYEMDIATVEVYFAKSSVLQMQRHFKLSWVDYFATVGGLLALLLGIGLVSVIEMVWFCLCVVARSLKR